MLPTAFQPFLEQTPVAVLAQSCLEGLFCNEDLDELFRTTARSGYQHELLFSTLVDLLLAVVLREQPSVHASYCHLLKQERITVGVDAVYDKLALLELGVSAALVTHSAQRIAPVLTQLRATEPSWLAGWRIRILDGSHLASTEHRLHELRQTWAGALPGKVLAILDQQTQLITDVFLTPDGHAQERSLLDEVLAAVQARDCWLADRNFCTCKFLFGLERAQASFVIRQHGGLPLQLQGERRQIGRTETGMVYEQAATLEYEGRTLPLRRITVELDEPTSDGDTEIHVLTNLTAMQAGACLVAEMYRKRWTIEGRFYEVTMTLNCEPQTLGYPKAALFAFCLALVASNAVSLLKGALRSVHGAAEVAELSAYYLTLEIQQTYRGMRVALPEEQWRFLRQLTTEQWANVLREIAARVCLEHYAKAKRGPKKKPPPRNRYKNGGHVSTHKLLQTRKL